jgi:hypothetical protein
MTTISASNTLGIFLDPATYSNPIVIASHVTVSNGTGAAVSTSPGFAEPFAVQNNGYISASSNGVNLAPGGSVTNAVSASITAGRYGVSISGGLGTVANYGSIVAFIGVDLNGGGSVTNAAAGWITGIDGVLLAGTIAGVVVNDGSILGTATRGAGIVLGFGGSVTNAASATIAGGYGIQIQAPGSVVNYGDIAGSGTGVAGVWLVAGGYVTNAAGASITGNFDGVLVDVSGTVVNDGSIATTGTGGIGVELELHGSVTNAAGASITGGTIGVSVDWGGTLTNAGTIATKLGNAGTAVAFGGTSANRLVLEPGFGFTGVVVGSASAGNTMELASAASSGTVTGLGTQFVDFYLIDFDAGAKWSIAGGTAALAGGEVISGFTTGDTIDVVGVSETIAGAGFGTLSLAGTAPLNLLLPGSLTAQRFRAAPSSDGTDITVACFAEGTRILTDTGERAVERLRPGMRVVSLLHRQLLPIAWLGHRTLREVWPVRVGAGAFAAGVPHRDLWLSPDHAVYVAPGVLVPVRCLINGATIRQEFRFEIRYYHVELAGHGVLLAEGLPAESYLDTGNRRAFSTGKARALPSPRELARRRTHQRPEAFGNPFIAALLPPARPPR